MKNILFPAWGLNSDHCTPQPLTSKSTARRLSALRHPADPVLQFPIQLFIWPQSRSVSGRLWFVVFFAYKKILGRTETRTRDKICFQTIRSVRDISRDDRARMATCSLRTATDRFKAHYSVDFRCNIETTAQDWAVWSKPS